LAKSIIYIDGRFRGKIKVRVPWQSSFGNLMDEPTNDLDFETIEWLENS
jgi:hypothetical protein